MVEERRRRWAACSSCSPWTTTWHGCRPTRRPERNAKPTHVVQMTIRQFDSGLIDFDGKTVLVTGGTGSFGRQFIRTVLERFKARRCIVFSRDEQKQCDMGQEIPDAQFREIRYFIGDVRDVDRLEMAMRGVDYVVHAAALKHVPIAEYNPFECVPANIDGAENVVKAAIRSGVTKVIALSTDKAARSEEHTFALTSL